LEDPEKKEPEAHRGGRYSLTDNNLKKSFIRYNLSPDRWDKAGCWTNVIVTLVDFLIILFILWVIYQKAYG
jgi:hypothetical protein